MTEGHEAPYDKAADAIGSFTEPARHRPADDGSIAAARGGEGGHSDEPGPPGDVDTRAQVSAEDSGDHTRQGLRIDGDGDAGGMTAAEAAGQVAYGTEEQGGSEDAAIGGSDTGSG